MTNNTPNDEGHPVDLLLPFLEKTRDPKEISTITNHVEKCDQCRQELKSLENITSALKTDKNVFCPEPWELYEFIGTGEDPGNKIANHLKECSLCRHEAESFKTAPANQKMPAQMWNELRKELPQSDSKKALLKAKATFWMLPSWSFSFIKIPMLATATAAAVLVLVLLYPGSQPKTVVALSSENWEESPGAVKLMSPNRKSPPVGELLKTESERAARESFERSRLMNDPTRVNVNAPAKMPTPGSVKPGGYYKLVAAKIIVFENKTKPLDEKIIDALYRAVEPSSESKKRFDFVSPITIKELVEKGTVKTANTLELLSGLKDQLNVSEAVVMTIASKDGKYDVKGQLINITKGNVLQEKIETGVTEDQLALKLHGLSELLN